MKFFCIFVPMFQPSNSRSLSPENFLFQKKVIQFLLTYKYLDLDPSVISATFKLLNYFWIYFISSSFVLDFEEPHALNSAPQASIFCFGLAIPCMLSTPGPNGELLSSLCMTTRRGEAPAHVGTIGGPSRWLCGSHSASGALSFS